MSRMNSIIRLREFARFCSAGALNTVITIGIYQLLLGWCGSSLAYTIAWLFGLALVGLFYPAVVYRVNSGVAARMRLVLSYACVFAVGLALTAAMDWLGVPRRAIVFLVAAMTALGSYYAGRISLWFGRSEPAAVHDQ